MDARLPRHQIRIALSWDVANLDQSSRMRLEQPAVSKAKTLRAGKPYTSLDKLEDYIRLCGGELGPNWQRDRITRQYIPPQEFHAAAGARSKKVYQTRTEVAQAMGLQPVPIPQVPKEPKKRKTTIDTRQTAAREPDLQTRVTIKDAAAKQQPKNKQEVTKPIQSSFNEGKQIVKLKQCLEKEGLNLQAGWAAECRIRKNGLGYDSFYHAPLGFKAGQGVNRIFGSMKEVVRAHKMAPKLNTTPQQTSALHGRAEHACAAAGMQSGGATGTSSSRTAYGSAAYIQLPQPGEIIVLSDSDTGSSDKEDVMVHGQSCAGGAAAAASAAAQGPAVHSSWQDAVRAAFVRGCSEQVSLPHFKGRR
ncbi:hypothetical protein COCOBI_11-2360 [Coccomyxa sp. Obi]|nr:hypothetical protein COCOBI_11-2360 [Coccomyxa sp. Obi]